MLEKQINSDYIQAMKAKDSDKSTVLNFLRAQLKNLKIEKKVDQLDDADVIQVLKKQVKQRQDSIQQYRDAGREDLAAKEEAEKIVIESYLPEQMSEEEVTRLVHEAVEETGASSMKDMGSVMKAVLEKTQGNADNKIVSEAVKKTLSSL